MGNGCNWDFSARERKRVSCSEVITSHIERIKSVNPSINAVTVLLEEEARLAAKELDRKLACGEPVGPLCGIPFTVKENIDLAGSSTTIGLPFLKDAVPLRSAPFVEQLIHAGAIPIGRTNLSEMGMRPHSDNPLRGATINPLNPSLTPGGSSGGDAAAISVGMTPFGVGNDYGGSLRTPAQFCGITSIKPSYGRVASFMSLMPEKPAICMQLFLSQGPMARSIGDLRLALFNMSGPDPRDPQWVPAPLIKEEKTGKPVIALVIDPANEGIDSVVEAEVRHAASIFESEGYIIEEVEPPSIMEAWKTYLELTGTELKVLMEQEVTQFLSQNLMTFLKYWSETVEINGPETYMQALASRNRIAREWAFFMEKYPVILGPVTTIEIPPVNFDILSRESAENFMHASRFAFPANLLGLPSLVMPAMETEQSSSAVQIISQRFREDLCLDTAEVLEKRRGKIIPVNPSI